MTRKKPGRPRLVRTEQGVDFHLKEFPIALRTDLKAEAARRNMSMREYVIMLLRAGLCR